MSTSFTFNVRTAKARLLVVRICTRAKRHPYYSARMVKRALVLGVAVFSLLASPAAHAQTAAEAHLLVRLNEIRTQGVSCPGSGRRPVAGALSDSVPHAQAARLQSGYMAASGQVTHTGQGGSTVRVRAASTGVNATSVTEIVYMGSGLDPEQAMRWWLGSAAHCYWMTEGRYTHAGTSIVQGARGTAYVIVLSSQPR